MRLPQLSTPHLYGFRAINKDLPKTPVVVEPWRISLIFIHADHSTTVVEHFKYGSDRYHSNLVDLYSNLSWFYAVKPPIYRFGSTHAWVGLVRISARVSAERPSFLCDYVQSKKTHRPGISSLLLTLEPCSVALPFAILFLLALTRDGGSALHQRWVSAPCFSPGAIVERR